MFLTNNSITKQICQIQPFVDSFKNLAENKTTNVDSKSNDRHARVFFCSTVLPFVFEISPSVAMLLKERSREISRHYWSKAIKILNFFSKFIESLFSRVTIQNLYNILFDYYPDIKTKLKLKNGCVSNCYLISLCWSHRAPNLNHQKSSFLYFFM